MDLLKTISGGAKIEDVKSGSGSVNERTVEFSNWVIAVENIGSMTVAEGQRGVVPKLVLAALVGIFGLYSLGSQFLLGVIVLAVAVLLLIWALTSKSDKYLSIHTCDSRSYTLVSKDKEFLAGVLDLLRSKIDTNNPKLMGTINIDTMQIDTSGGGVALGVGSAATGAAR